MAANSIADKELGRQVRDCGFPDFTARDARFLREREVFRLPPARERHGGRSKLTEYPPGSVEIACAIEAAKRDPLYRRRFHKAVLIAWAGARADVSDVALRPALREEQRLERERARKATTMRKDRAPKGPLNELPGPERVRALGAVSDVILGERPTPQAGRALAERVTEFLTSGLSELEGAGEDASASSSVVEPLPTVLQLLSSPAAAEGALSSLAKASPEAFALFTGVMGEMFEMITKVITAVPTSAALPDPDSRGDVLAPLSRLLVSQAAEASASVAAAYAPRADLDAARDLVRHLMPGTHPLEVAMVAPHWMALFRDYNPGARIQARSGEPLGPLSQDDDP